MTRDEYEAMVAAAERTELISRGKQLALATLMYAQDYDETLPTGDNITGKLSPYLQNDSMFEGFSYTFGGGKLKDIDKPVETELGFLPGTGGRVVIYVDGHVKWMNDK